MPASRLLRIQASGTGLIFSLFALQLLVLAPIGFSRLIDGDEGYYLFAAKLVMQGQVPYRDFLYTQMPLLPYVYGVWMEVFGFSWYAGRGLSVLLTAATGTILYSCLLSLRSGRNAALLGLLLYITSAHVLGWFSVAKTYALSTFLLLAAYAVLCRLSGHGWYKRCLLSGLLLGLAIDTRLLFVAAVPALLWGIHRQMPRQAATRGVALFLAGLFAGLAPVAYFVLADPAAFHFGNIGYHAVRSAHDLLGDPQQKGRILLEAVGIGGGRGVLSFQFLLLLLPTFAYALLGYRRENGTDTALHIGLALLLVSLLPTPSYLQYFSVLIPFMILCTVTLADALPTGRPGLTEPGRIFVQFFFILHALAAPLDVWRFTASGDQLPGLGQPWERADWRIPAVRAVSGAIDRLNPSGRPVIALWPGYMLEADSPVLPGCENHFGIGAADRLPSSQRRRFHLVGLDDIAGRIAADSLLVVLGNWHRAFPQQTLSTNGYSAAFRRGGAALYHRLPARSP